MKELKEKKKLTRKQLKRKRHRRKIFRFVWFMTIIGFFVIVGCGLGIYAGIIKDAENAI